MAKTDRPHMPGYGLEAPTDKAGLLPWEFVSTRMEAAHNYWIVTASLAGRPHAAPVWGIWVEGSFYFSTGRQSRKGRNLAENPQLVVHLESGDEVVNLEGVAGEVAPGPLFSHLDEIYYAKYAVHLTDANPVYVLRPVLVMAWRERDFPTTATRWRFDTPPEEAG